MSNDPIVAALLRLEAGQAKLEAGQAKLETGHDKLRTDFLDGPGNMRIAIMERIDRLQDRFDEVRADVTVNFNNPARIEDSGISTQNELRATDARVRLLEDKARRSPASSRDRMPRSPFSAKRIRSDGLDSALAASQTSVIGGRHKWPHGSASPASPAEWASCWSKKWRRPAAR